ncbi:MAG: glycine cleavage system protein H [Candidatus Promineifilaceae bacterium]|jgi:glycine cleavage system H protein
MSEHLTFTQDKFTFQVARDRHYNTAGVWAKAEGERVLVGVSDFFQQSKGDVAFAEVSEVGTAVAAGEVFANIETIKLDIDLPSPLNGKIVAVNEALELEAELINHDPYGAGWLAEFASSDWPAVRDKLMTPQQYFEHMKNEARAQGDQ